MVLTPLTFSLLRIIQERENVEEDVILDDWKKFKNKESYPFTWI